MSQIPTLYLRYSFSKWYYKPIGKFYSIMINHGRKIVKVHKFPQYNLTKFHWDNVQSYVIDQYSTGYIKF